MSFDDDSAFSNLKYKACIDDLSNRTCEYVFKRGKRIGVACGASLKEEGRGGMIDDLNYCYFDLKKEINFRSSQQLPLNDVIFLIQKDSIYHQQEIYNETEKHEQEQEQQEGEEIHNNKEEQKQQEGKEINNNTANTHEEKQQQQGATCQYKFVRDGKLHPKDTICGNPVAKHPIVKGGENVCSAHLPTVGEANEKCETTYFRDGEEKQCHNNVESEGQRFCQKCIVMQEVESKKEKERYEVTKEKNQRRKCPRRLKRGTRQGKICNETLPLNCEDDQKYCNKCLKTKDAQKQEDESDSLSVSNDDDDDEIEILPMDERPLTDFPILIGSTDRTQIPISKLPVAPHWKFILEMLVLKSIEPGPLAKTMYWFANGKFKCSHGGNIMFELVGNEWKKISSRTMRINRLFEELTTHLVEKVILPLKSSHQELIVLLNSIQINLARNLQKPVSNLAIERFIELLTQEEKKAKAEMKIDPHEINLIEFVRNHIKPITDRNKAISTTTILIHFNDWLVKNGKPSYSSGPVHFGRLLHKINAANARWKVLGGKHLVQLF
jgi:hypothetical protein